MKLDRNMLDQMLKLPDDELWRQVVSIAKTHGFTLSDKTPQHEELERLRGIARDGMNINPITAMKLLNKYKG